MWSWLWGRKYRRQELALHPFPETWEALLHSHCRHFVSLTEAERRRLRNDVRVLIAEKNWEGCNGLKVTEEMQVTIAAQAALMSLGFPELPFDRLITLLVYPETFVGKRTTQIAGGGYLESNEPRLGEAWYQGAIILVWREIREQCLKSPQGRNVVIHEFAHLLDMENRDIDGIPSMENQEQFDTWRAVTGEEFRRLQRQTSHGYPTVLDSYGATNPAEFFAVASETFFEQPLRFRTELPRLYEVFQMFYRQDPAARVSKMA